MTTPVSTNEFILHQGSTLQVQDFKLSGLNSGLLFGESAFTSFRTFNGKVAFFEKHILRLLNSCEYLDFETDSGLWESIEEDCHDLFESNSNHYFRITIFSNLDGSVDFFIWVKPLPPVLKSVKLKTIKADHPLFFDEVKIGSYAPIFHLGRKLRKDHPEFDEFLLVSNDEKETGSEIFEAAMNIQ